MEEFMNLFLEATPDEDKNDVIITIKNIRRNVGTLSEYTNFNDVEFDIIVMDLLLDNPIKKNMKRMIEIFMTHITIRSLNGCRKTEFVKNCRSGYYRFYMRSLNDVVVDAVFPDWKKIRVCDILPDTYVNHMQFKSDYDIKFIL